MEISASQSFFRFSLVVSICSNIFYTTNIIIITLTLFKKLSRTPTGPAKKFGVANVGDSGKFKILAFCKALGKPDTIFTSVLTLVSLIGNRREKINRYF